MTRERVLEKSANLQGFSIHLKEKDIKMRTIILGFCFIFVTAVKAEDVNRIIDKASFCCVYRHFTKTVNLEKASVTDSAVAILEVGETVAKYGDFASYQGETPKGLTSGYAAGDPRSGDGVTVYSGFPESGRLTVREALLPNFYVYEETLALSWEMMDGTEHVLGYKCEKAKARYGGRTWTVYYAPEIPAAAGPWKLTGLPGLILKAESADSVHRFVAQAVFNVDSQDIVFEKKEKDVNVKRNKFVSLRNRLKTDEQWAKNAAYYLGKADFKSITVVNEKNDYGLAPSLTINGIGLPPSGGFGHLFQPLEIE